MRQQVEIRVEGRLDEHWSEWFDGLTIDHSGQDETVLAGLVPDQSAVYGLIAKLRDLGLPLRSVSCVEHEGEGNSHR
jgi:hypothetical protein